MDLVKLTVRISDKDTDIKEVKTINPEELERLGHLRSFAMKTELKGMVDRVVSKYLKED